MLVRNPRALAEVLIERPRLIAEPQRVRAVQGRRGVGRIHRAVDVDGALHAPPAEHQRPARQSRVHADLESGVGVLAEARVGHVAEVQVGRDPVLVLIDLKDGDLFACERVDDRRRRPVVDRIDRAVASVGRVVQQAAEPVEVDRDAGHQLVLNARPVLQVVFALEARVERAVRDLAEIRVVAGTNLVVLGDAVVVGRQTAAHDVEVGPRARVGECSDRVEQVRERADVGRHVLAEARLQCRLAVAEHVVRDAESRRPRRPARHAWKRLTRDGVVILRRREAARVAVLRRDFFLEELEADPIGDREFVDDPLILRVESQIRPQLGRPGERRVVRPNLDRPAEAVHAVHERASLIDLIEVGIHVHYRGIVAPTPEHPRPDVVRAGHVGERGYGGVLIRRVELGELADLGADQRPARDSVETRGVAALLTTRRARTSS